MSYYVWGLIVLFSLTILFYIVFFSLVYYWHEKRITFLVVPLIFTFEFFLVAVLVISLCYIIATHLGDVLSLF